MKRILQAISIAVAVCAVQRLVAIDYVISGNQTVYNVDGLKTSAVMTVSFTLTRAGTNWAISNTYTNTGVKDTIALAGGCTYSVTTDPSGASAGLVMDDPIDRLDVATVFPRVLVLAFLTPQQRLEDVTNAPVPFLWPHHAALHCYRWSFKWSNEAPWLPAQVRFELDRDLARRVHPDVISSYFRSGYRDRALFKQFQETQRTGAQYSVAAWTNWQGASLPLRAMISFTTFDHVTGGGTIRQLLTVAV